MMRQAKRELIDDPVLLRILELLKEKGRTEKEMVEYLGLGNGAFTHWKYDNHKSAAYCEDGGIPGSDTELFVVRKG